MDALRLLDGTALRRTGRAIEQRAKFVLMACMVREDMVEELW